MDDSNLFVASIEPKKDYFKMVLKIKPEIEKMNKE